MFTRSKSMLALGAAVCVWFSASVAMALDLNDVRSWDIVVNENSSPAERYAAEEFQRVFALAADGVKLPIKNAPGKGRGAVFVGPDAAATAATAMPALKEPIAGEEDFAIVIADNAIWITGGRPRGTLYGVYAFLEDHLGVRFLTADHTHVPPLKKGTNVAPSQRTFRPKLEFRTSYYGETERNPAFATRLRQNTVSDDLKLGGRTTMRLINHSFSRYVSWKKYGEQHPEYFNEINGKRPANITDDQFNPGVQLCLTNTDVLRIVTEGVLADLAAQPALRNISVSQNDNYQHCRCEKCKAIDDREGTPMGSLLTFVNAVAAEVKKKHPDVYVGTLAYQYSRKPPKTLRPAANVQIQLCSIECCMNHSLETADCPINAAFRADMHGWGKISENIYVWYYITNFADYLLPCANLRIIAPDVRYFVKNNAKGVMMQGAYNAVGAEMSDLRNYVTSRLIWDPSLDADKLADEFLDLHYGKAAKPIREYLAFSHDRASKSGKHDRCSRAGGCYGLDRAVADMAIKKFDEALALADDDVIKARVERASICAPAMMLDALLNVGTDTTVYSRVRKNKPVLPDVTPAALAEARPYVRRLFDVADRHGITMCSEWLTVTQGHDAYRKIYELKDGEKF